MHDPKHSGDTLDTDARKLYPAADLPRVGPVFPAVPEPLAPPSFIFAGPHGPVPIADQDVDRQIAVSILEELRGLREDLRTYHAANFSQLVCIEGAARSHQDP